MLATSTDRCTTTWSVGYTSVQSTCMVLSDEWLSSVKLVDYCTLNYWYLASIHVVCAFLSYLGREC